MKIQFILSALLFCFIFECAAYARGGGGRSSRSSSRSNSYKGSTSSYKAKARSAGAKVTKNSRKVQGVARDKHGKIKRSATAIRDFKKTHPCPSGMVRVKAMS